LAIYQYIISDGKVKAKGFEDAIIVLDLSAWKPELINYYRSLLAQQRDMEYAQAYLNQMFFQRDTSLIDGALINSAIQLLVKCFASQNGDGRRPLDSKKVFRTYAKKIGECDLTKQFSQFYDARNHVISHDQKNFKENIVGIAVDLRENQAEEIATLTIRTGYLYKENQQILIRLVKVVQSYIEEQIKNLDKMLIDGFNKSLPKPFLDVARCEEIPMATAW